MTAEHCGDFFEHFHLVNAVAPFILDAQLKPLMLRTTERDKHGSLA